MSDCAIVVGAGLAGRLCALALLDRGWRVTLLDWGDRSGQGSAATVAAGMLAPYAELDTAEPLVFALGVRSRQLWPAILARLPGKVFYQNTGTLLIAHRQDRAELERFTARLKAKLGDRAVMESLDGEGIARLEPELAGRFSRGVLFPDEGQLDPLELFPALERALVEAGVDWREGLGADTLAPGRVEAGGQSLRAELVVDARGLGAKGDIPTLRGIRGEIVTVHAPELRLNRLVRLMHPRYPLYICPRREGRFVIGATSIESEDLSPISVQSLLELLSAAYSLHSGFAEARVLA
ncbi:MAG: FAD-dependent oxidoreductase, partial [Candidatus Competibacteraceae bacterium]|nr:FAD-dependent oxidoreductase [Candidatus Competibacteraceae bacterium]